MIRAAPLALLLLPALAAAGGLRPGDAPIPPEEWRAMTEGRTVTYLLDGRLWGREFFHPGGGQATFVAPDGFCMTGPWAYGDGLYCFAYSGLDCFRHVRRGEKIFIIPEVGGPDQEVASIETAPLSCDPGLSS